METAARTLFRSLRKMREFPEYLQLWPGHGAGSACGKSLGAMPSTTLGYERLFNWAFQATDEDEFVRTVLAGQPEPPRYFGRMKRLNRDGPPPQPARSARQFDVAAIATALDEHRATIVDTRSSASFAAAFIPGTINIPGNRSFTAWAGSLVADDRDVMLIVDDEQRGRALTRELSLIGVDRVIGWADADVLNAWRASGRPLDHVHAVNARALAELDGAEVIDVRAASEFEEGHVPGARHIFLGNLLEVQDQLPRDRPLVVACQGGSRSSIGASLLRAHGFTNVINFTGGFSEWRNAGLPVETPDAPAASR
jgi:hydroxyacylglutathione hydrolase